MSQERQQWKIDSVNKDYERLNKHEQKQLNDIALSLFNFKTLNEQRQVSPRLLIKIISKKKINH